MIRFAKLNPRSIEWKKLWQDVIYSVKWISSKSCECWLSGDCRVIW